MRLPLPGRLPPSLPSEGGEGGRRVGASHMSFPLDARALRASKGTFPWVRTWRSSSAIAQTTGCRPGSASAMFLSIGAFEKEVEHV